MNIFRLQKVYVFHPPIHSAIFTPLLQWVSDVFYLHRKFNVRDVQAEGVERIAELSRAGDTVLIAPNHGDHGDPHVMTHISRRLGLFLYFMAAREGFERRRLHAFILQRCGAFSVNREGADIAAFKMALKILQEARHPLVVFPEGEIYHHLEKLDPLNEGVATIILRSLKDMPDDRKVWLAPVALRYRYDDAAAETFDERLTVLEERITWRPRPDLNVVDRIYRLGAGLLALKEVEHLGQPQSGELLERIANLRNQLVERVEERRGVRAKSDVTPERVKTLRNSIRQKLTDEKNQPSPEEEREAYGDLEILFLVQQLYSYPAPYLKEKPSVHRIAETILKLEEDVQENPQYPVPRDVRVRFDEPIDVREFLREGALDAKTAAAPLTALLGQRIQAMLEEM